MPRATSSSPQCGGDLIEHAPSLYQLDVAGARQTVPGTYAVLGPDTVGFAVGPHDPTRPLVIDPVIGYSTYLGGAGTDSGQAVALDPSGSVYVTGNTASTNFPGTSNFYQPGYGGGITTPS
jgi:hypothetical protein